MNNNRIRWFVRIHGTGWRTHLQTLTGIFHRTLTRQLGQTQSFKGHTKTGAVHHSEHRRQGHADKTQQRHSLLPELFQSLADLPEKFAPGWGVFAR